MPAPLPVDPAVDAEYDNRARVPAHPEIFTRWARDSARVRGAWGARVDVPYGAMPRQCLDILVPARPSRGMLVFIHGGYWRSLDKSMFSFIAPALLDGGIGVALVNYRLCPGARIGDAVDDVGLALDWLAREGDAAGLDTRAMVLAGHSAGAHLAAMQWVRPHPAWRDRIAGGIALSGVHDLAPLLQCTVNADLRLDAEDAAAWSPARHAPVLDAPLLVLAGEQDSAAFRWQSRRLADAWPATCTPMPTIEGADHFTVVDAFASAHGPALAWARDRLAVRAR